MDSQARARRPLPVLFGALLALLAPLSAQSPSSVSAEQLLHLRGTVVNSVTHEPVPHALVLSPDNRFATMTDDRGNFEFSLPQVQSPTRSLRSNEGPQPTVTETFGPGPQSPNRPYILAARKPGYIQSPDGADQIPVGPDATDITIPLLPEARIIGRIANASRPDRFGGPQVSICRRDFYEGVVRWNDVASVQARSNGEFRFADLPAGTYKLFTRERLDRDPLTFDFRSQLYGYPPVFFPSASDFQSAASIQLAAGETFQATLTPSRREYYPVRIPVNSASPENGMDVQVWQQGHPGPAYMLGIDPRNGLIRGSLPNGVYTVMVRSFQQPPLLGQTNITVAGAPATASPIVFTLPTSVQVTVREEFQHPPPVSSYQQATLAGGNSESFRVSPRRAGYLQVRLIPAEQYGGAVQEAALRPPTGPDDESLVIENVLIGSYRVRCYTSWGYVASATSGNVNVLRQPLIVASGAAPDPIEITLRDDSAEVSGTVESLAKVASQDKGLLSQRSTTSLTAAFPRRITFSRSPTVHFIPLPEGSGTFSVVPVSPDGKFQFNQIVPGSYRVLVLDRPRPELELATENELRRYDSRSQFVEFAPGEKKPLKLVLASAED